MTETDRCDACDGIRPGPGVTLHCDVCGIVTLPLPLLPVLPSITRSEARVLDCLARGLTAQQAADELCIDKRTVEKHIANVSRRLGLTSAHPTVEAAVLYRSGALRVEGGR